MRSQMRMALVVVVYGASAATLLAQKVRDENPYYLRADKRLQVSLQVEADHPKISQIVAQLCEATQLDIAVDAGLRDHAPELGYIQPSKRGYRAWQIMEMIARKDLQRGYWEKTSSGYRLAGTSLLAAAKAPPERGSGLLLWLALSGASLLVVLFVVVLVRKRVARAGKRVATKRHISVKAPS